MHSSLQIYIPTQPHNATPQMPSSTEDGNQEGHYFTSGQLLLPWFAGKNLTCLILKLWRKGKCNVDAADSPDYPITKASTDTLMRNLLQHYLNIYSFSLYCCNFNGFPTQELLAICSSCSFQWLQGDDEQPLRLQCFSNTMWVFHWRALASLNISEIAPDTDLLLCQCHTPEPAVSCT